MLACACNFVHIHKYIVLADMSADVCMRVSLTLRVIYLNSVYMFIVKPVVQEALNLFKFFFAETILIRSIFPPLMIVENGPDFLISVRLWTGFSVTCIHQEVLL